MVDIIVPTPGESITEVEIGSWLIENGSWVDQDQEIASIESEKATLEITAPASGYLEILATEGQAIGVGEVMGKIKPGEPKAGETRVKKQEKATPEKDDNADLPKSEKKTDTEPLDVIKVTPVAKKIMASHQLNVDDIVKGLKRIGKAEVEQVLNLKDTPIETGSAQPVMATERSHDRKRMSLLRRKLAERLVDVKNNTAMLTTFNELDMSAVMTLRNQYKQRFQDKHGVKLGFMSFFSLAAARALMAFPNINARIDGEDIILFNYADIGVAVQTPKGLMVPVIRDVHKKGLAEIELALANLATKARENKISLDELDGGTFSITNGGVFGSLLSTPILNPPQSAILGMHNIVERPVAIEGQVVIRPMMYVALSYDHRIVDGKDSVGFLKTIKELIESPHKLLDPLGKPDQRLLGL